MDKRIELLRMKIDYWDDNIIRLLERREQEAKAIASIKKKLKMKIEDSKREREIVDRLSKNSELEKKFIKKVYEQIFSYVKKR